jgi:hypothetical protein
MLNNRFLPSSLTHLFPCCPFPADWKLVHTIVPSGTFSDRIKAEAKVLVDSIFLQKMNFDPIIIDATVYFKYAIIAVISPESRNGT